MSEEIIMQTKAHSTQSRNIARALIVAVGVPALLFIGLATTHFIVSNYNFVFVHGNRGLGMVVTASFALLVLSIALTAKKAFILGKETRQLIQTANEANIAVPSDLSAPGWFANAWHNHPITIAAWLPALVVGGFIYATILVNLSMSRLQSTFKLTSSGGTDQLMIEALWTFAVLLTANITIGLVWAKIWRNKSLKRRAALSSLRAQIDQLALPEASPQ